MNPPPVSQAIPHPLQQQHQTYQSSISTIMEQTVINGPRSHPHTHTQYIINEQVPIVNLPRIVQHRNPQQLVSTIIQQSTLVRSQVRPVSELIPNNGMNTNPHTQSKQVIRTLEDDQGMSQHSQPRGRAMSFDHEKEELKQEVKRLQGLLKKNESETEGIRRELNVKNQTVSEFEKKVNSVQHNKSKFSGQIKSLEDQIAKLNSIIQRLKADRKTLVQQHEEYLKGDENARTQIFGQITRLREAIQVRTKELNESKQRQFLVAKKFEAYVSQAGNEFSQGRRDTAHILEKLKIALEGKELQIDSLNQAIVQLDSNLLSSQSIRNQQLLKIKSQESRLMRLQAENESFREYQENRAGELNEAEILKMEVVELKRSIDAHQSRESQKVYDRQAISSNSTEKDLEIQRLRIALQSLESNGVTLEHLSKEVHNYKIIVEDLQTYKDNSYKKDIEITRLHQILVAKEKEICDLQSNADILRNRISTSEYQLRSIQETSKDKMVQLQAKILDLNRKSELSHAEKSGLGQVTAAQSQVQIYELTKALDQSRTEFFAFRKVSDQRLFELQTAKSELQLKARQIDQVVQQKEAERVFFQNQYKSVYSEFLLMRKQSPDGQPIEAQIKDLREELYHSQEQCNRLSFQLKRVTDSDKVKGSFNSNDQYFRARHAAQANHNSNPKLGDHNPNSLSRKQQHHRVVESHSSLREENERLKQLLEDAAFKVQEYSGDLEECQVRMAHFQDRMETLLAGGNPGSHQINYHQSIQEQKHMMDQVVIELRSKLKQFKRENQGLKKKVKEVRQQSRRTKSKDAHKNLDKRRSKDSDGNRQEAVRSEKNISDKQKETELIIQGKDSSIEELNKQIELLTSEIEGLRRQEGETQAIVNQYEGDMTQYQATINQYQARIKEYQNHLLKIKHRYKQVDQAHLKLPGPDIQRIERPPHPVKHSEERAQFFKSKSQEAEQRINKLLRINKELTIQLEQTSSLIGVENLSMHNVQLLQDNITNLEKKLANATEQNLELRARAETVDNNPPLSEILELKMRQLMEENSDLRVQISQASNEINILRLPASQATIREHSSPTDLMKFEQLEHKFASLNQVISTLEYEKNLLVSENQSLKAKGGRDQISSQNDLLQQVATLQQQLYHVKSLNHQLERQYKEVSTDPKGVSLQAYNILLMEMDKLLYQFDNLHDIFSNLAQYIDRMGSGILKEAVQEVFSNARDVLQMIEMVKYSVGGLRQKSEAATVIHEINQII